MGEAAHIIEGATAPRVLAIVGPTASGKSALALAVAARLPAEIVCCDSQQVYAGMDIGTGKATPTDRAAVPHHLLDVVPPTEAFQAARWAALARQAVGDIAARGRVPLVVGGTGLYLRALLVGLFDAPPPDEAIRQRHRDEAERAGVEALHARLAEIDPDTAARVQRRDLVRISRALEVHEQTGLSMTALRRAQSPAPRIDATTLVLDPPLTDLRDRIAARFDAMMAAGFLDETRALRARFGGDARGLQALGYRQLGEHLDGRSSLDDAVAAGKAATATYARRQRTWFRQDTTAWRVAAAPDAAAVVHWWEGGAPAAVNTAASTPR